MSNLSFENIDQWLFEFTEGNLSPAQESQLMDFLSTHPELMEELKMWQHAKVSPATTDSHVNMSALTKEKPLLLRSVSFAVFGILGLLLAWLAFYNFPYQQQYASVEVDTKIIQIETEKFSFKENNLAFSKVEKSHQNTSNNTQKKTSIHQTVTTNEAIASPIDLSNNNKASLTAASSSTAETLLTESLNHDDIAFYSEMKEIKEMKNSIPKTHELEEIIDFINKKDEKTAFTEHELARVDESKSREVAEVTKVSQNRAFTNFSRKIKRMIDQPTALRNTQSPYYHAPMMTGFKANPSMVGKETANRIQATSRLQWLEKENEQFINSLSWDGYIYSLRGGLGVDLNYSMYNGNSLNNYSVGIVYSPKISIHNNLSFEPSMSFKMGVIDIDPRSDFIGSKIEMHRNNSLAFFEGEEQATGSQLWYKDVGLGFMLNTKSFYIGFNADNLTRHNNNYYSNNIHKKYRENIHYTAVIGTEYRSLTRNLSINGYGLFQNYGNLNELWVGANFRYKWMHIGGGVNTDLDFGLSAGANIKRATLHYNIDYINSQLMNRKGLSHQLTLKILLKQNRYATKFLNL